MSQTTEPTLEHHYAPRGACRDLVYCHDPEVLLSGPAGTGKSRACLEWLNIVALAFPGMRGLIVRKTLSSLSSTALVTWKRDVVPEAMSTGEVKFHGGGTENPAQYRYRNGSTITLGGMDKATKIMSSEYDMIYVQEAIELSEDDWESLTTRLRNGVMPWQQIISDTNPSTPTHWLKQRGDAGKTTILESRHEDNPRYFDADGTITEEGRVYLAKLDGLTGPRHSRLRKGLWTSAEGMIFDEFDPATHVVELDPFSPPKFDRWIWAVDFGYTNPLCFQAWGVDGDGRMFLVREIYETGILVADLAKRILNLGLPRPQSIVVDPAAAEDRATLAKGLKRGTTAANKSVTDGIQAVKQRFRDNRLFIARRALVRPDQSLEDAKKPTCTLEEIPGYVWADNQVKDVPVKVDDHGCDTMRYAVSLLDNRSRPRVRFM